MRESKFLLFVILQLKEEIFPFENITPEHTGRPNTLYTYIPVINAVYLLKGVLFMGAWCIHKHTQANTYKTNKRLLKNEQQYRLHY